MGSFHGSEERKCSECGKRFTAGGSKFWRDENDPNPQRNAFAETCSDECARARKTRFQKRRRDAERAPKKRRA